MNQNERFLYAKEKYGAFGVDTEEAIRILSETPISMHCWQGDDVRGFENAGPLTGGIQATGNYPGAARTPEELMADFDKALSLIPGKAGSAPVQNIGAYGCEAKDAIRRVEMYCVETGNLLTLDAAHCGFGYRESVFKHDLKGRVIITAIEIRLSHTPRPKLGYGDVEREVEARGGATLRNIREAICSIRRAKLPDPAVLGNAGSFFKNPVVEAPVAERLLAEYPDMPHYAAPEGRVKLAAGWLIDRAGMKGYREGSVGVHERQALVLVNHGGATGGEVIAFARTVQAKVREKFGIEIDTEVNIL